MKTMKKFLVLPVIASSAFLFGIHTSAINVNAASTTNFTTYTSSENIVLNNQSISITQSWTYTISWTLSDGMILVDVWEKETVTINLSGVNITNKTWAAIYVKSWKATINLVENTTNILTDAKEYTNLIYDENATISAKEDLIISGTWILIINANYNDWINTKDDLTIKNWDITIVAVDDGIRWKDSITIENWILNITSGGDALKSDNENKWYITINGGTLNISAGSDGMEAYNELTINAWKINISNSYEWLESQIITINWWEIYIKSSDDGINASDSSATTENRPWVWNDNLKIIINWWKVIIDSDADWLDSNWNIEVNGGEIIVFWPTSNWDAAVDYDGKFTINWWDFVAFGSSWMAQNASDGSTQNTVLINLTSTQSSWAKFTIKNSSGTTVFESTSKKSFSSVLVSTSSLKNGTYTYEVNGTKIWDFTISSIISQVWTGGWFGGGRWGFGNFGGQNFWWENNWNFRGGRWNFQNNWEQNLNTRNNWQKNLYNNNGYFNNNADNFFYDLQKEIDKVLEQVEKFYLKYSQTEKNEIYVGIIERLRRMDTSNFDNRKKYIVNALISGLENLKK